MDQSNKCYRLYVKRGKYGGTYAHKDIAFEFASVISPAFKLYLIKEFQRLKEKENNLKQIEWDAKRFLTKNNYLIRTDAVKNYLLPQMNYRENLQWLTYAEYQLNVLNTAEQIKKIEICDNDLTSSGRCVTGNIPGEH